MKHSLTILILMIALGAGTAQSASPIFDSGERRPSVGFRIGWDVTSPSMDHDDVGVYRNGSGFTAGVVANIPLWRNLYIEPGVGVFYNTIKFKDMMDLPGHQEEEGVAVAHTSGSIRNWGIRMPLAVGYRLDFTPTVSVSFYTGPQVNFGLSARQNWVSTVDDESTTVRRDLYKSPNAGMERIDVQWAFGVGLTLHRNWHIGIGGAAGMTNLLKGKYYTHQTLHRNNFTIRCGWNF